MSPTAEGTAPTTGPSTRSTRRSTALATASAASTDPAPPPPASTSKKRARTEEGDDFDLAPTSEPAGIIDSDDDRYHSEAEKEEDEDEEEPAKKKAKSKGKRRARPVAKKVVVWKDIQKWKEGDDPLGRFPVEVLDLIISIDSDLDLRDHLALAATCRYFRSAYRDVVFQVLFQAAFPKLRSYAPSVYIDEDGEPLEQYTYDAPLGPWERGLNAGRRIFSSGRSLVGAGGWKGWGLTREEFDALEQQTRIGKDTIDALIQKDFDDHPVEISPATVASMSRYIDSLEEERRVGRLQAFRESELARLERERRNEKYKLREVYDLDTEVGEEPSYSFYNRMSVSRSDHYDPWPSVWRDKVSQVVLKPSINKTNAKTKYKVNDRELLGLSLRPFAYGHRSNEKIYFKAAVEALSLRSHGGISGHKEHVAKLEAVKNKALATRKKNGTYVEKKPKPLSRREQLWKAQAAILAAYQSNPMGLAAMMAAEAEYSDEFYSDGYPDEYDSGLEAMFGGGGYYSDEDDDGY